MGTIQGKIVKKGETEFTLLSEGKEVTHPLSQRVVSFVGSLKEGDTVDFDVRDGEISFIKKVYQTYTPKAPVVSRPAPTPAKPAVAPATPVTPAKVVEKPVEKVAPTTAHVEEMRKVGNDSTPAETIAEATEKLTKGLSNEAPPAKPKPVAGATPAQVQQWRTTLGEKDIKISLMASMKVASEIVCQTLASSPNLLDMGEEKLSLKEMNDAVAGEITRLTEMLDVWMDKKASEKMKK